MLFATIYLKSEPAAIFISNDVAFPMLLLLSAHLSEGGCARTAGPRRGHDLNDHESLLRAAVGLELMIMMQTSVV